MTRKLRGKPIAVKAAELAYAVPLVIAQRSARMAAARRPVPTKRDRIEFTRMHAEKAAALMESWNAMALHAWRVHHAFTVSSVRTLQTTWMRPDASALAAAWRLQSQSASLVHKVLDPVHRRVMANARRLAKHR